MLIIAPPKPLMRLLPPSFFVKEGIFRALVQSVFSAPVGPPTDSRQWLNDVTRCCDSCVTHSADFASGMWALAGDRESKSGLKTVASSSLGAAKRRPQNLLRR